MKRCKCGGRLEEDALTGIHVCQRCGAGQTNSGRRICRECVAGNCDMCESWREGYCAHECFLQGYYGRAEDIGLITAGDY